MGDNVVDHMVIPIKRRKMQRRKTIIAPRLTIQPILEVFLVIFLIICPTFPKFQNMLTQYLYTFLTILKRCKMYRSIPFGIIYLRDVNHSACGSSLAITPQGGTCEVIQVVFKFAVVQPFDVSINSLFISQSIWASYLFFDVQVARVCLKCHLVEIEPFGCLSGACWNLYITYLLPNSFLNVRICFCVVVTFFYHGRDYGIVLRFETVQIWLLGIEVHREIPGTLVFWL